MKVFISGGCKNGKSFHGQQMAMEMAKKKKVRLYYVATMKPRDKEDIERVKRHKEERKNWGFETIEQEKDIEEILHKIPRESVVFLDSVTALLENEMFDENYNLNQNSPEKVENELKKICEKIDDVIFISDYIYGDGIVYDETTERYRSGLARLDRAISRECEKVFEVTFGNLKEYK